MEKYLGIFLIVASIVMLVILIGCAGYQPPGEDMWLYLSVVEKL